MISIKIRRLSKRFGPVAVLSELDLAIAPGEFFFILGPSGGGKTTLLRTLAGFHVPDRGQILFDEEDVTGLPPHKRNAGLVFQSYALWPHLTVAKNVAFGLEERGVPRQEVERRVAEALASVRMDAFAGRKPAELSGGQQQRVALARSLVVRPRCLLLDEPLSNLDTKLRTDLRTEIRRVCKESRVTTVYVTHDQKEAFSTADRVAVLDGGRILQTGTPQEIYRRPANKAVAGFVGEASFISGKIITASGSQARVETAMGRFAGAVSGSAAKLGPGSPVTLAVRPESWRLVRDSSEGLNRVRGKIGGATYLGGAVQCDFLVGSDMLKIVMPADYSPAREGVDSVVSVDPEDVIVLAE